MLTEILLTIDAQKNGSPPTRSDGPESTFWTGREGQMCVQKFRPKAGAQYLPHTHSEYTIAVCVEGEIVLTQMGQTDVAGPGGAIMGNYGVEHASGYFVRPGKPCEAVSLSFDRKLLATLTEEFKLPSVSDDTCPAFLGTLERPVVHECAKAIARELKEGKPGHGLAIESLAMQLLIEGLRSWKRTDISKINANNAPRLPRKDFIRAYEFMRWCRKENFRLQHLCQFLGSSEERFTRLFLASANETPAVFYNRMLMERARDLLRDPNLSVKEIGFDLGFKTSSHFISAFRREFKASPMEYRKS